MWHFRSVRLLVVGLLLSWAGAIPALGQGPKKSDAVVKVEAAASKLADDGTQVVTINLAITKGWHIYANPVGREDQEPSQTTVTITSAKKLEGVRIEYPEGKLIKDKEIGGQYRIYEGKAIIKAAVRRASGDSGPLEVRVKFMACSASSCLLPATVKLSVP
jgi:DsbC/DsbD-like thiol-disulfide interchange protein